MTDPNVPEGLTAVLAVHSLFAEDGLGHVYCRCDRRDRAFAHRADHRTHVAAAVHAWYAAAVLSPEVGEEAARVIAERSARHWVVPVSDQHRETARAALAAALAAVGQVTTEEVRGDG